MSKKRRYLSRFLFTFVYFRRTVSRCTAGSAVFLNFLKRESEVTPIVEECSCGQPSLVDSVVAY